MQIRIIENKKRGNYGGSEVSLVRNDEKKFIISYVYIYVDYR